MGEVYCVARLESSLDEVKLFSTADSATDYAHASGLKDPVVLVYKLNPSTHEYELTSFAEAEPSSSDASSDS